MRDRWPQERVFTYWDDRAGMFPRDLGMRIDLVLARATVASRVRAAWGDPQARNGSATRAGIVATVNSSGATSGSSSQASGEDTGAPAFGRRLSAEAMVRSRAFWLSSMKMRFPRRARRRRSPCPAAGPGRCAARPG
jgi:hypothetical protein